MKKILETLYLEHRNKCNTYKDENDRITYNENALKKSLTKHERKLLLRIIDDSNLITEKASADNFLNGAAIGARLMMELLYSSK